MNFQVHKYELPRLTLSYEELTALIHQLLKVRSGGLDFNGIVGLVAAHLVKTQTGFTVEPHTTYAPRINKGDEARIREIIWDLIILRYLTPGGYGHDEWPSLTITERGKTYFEQV